MSALSTRKETLVSDIETLAAEHLPDERVVVWGYEPREVPGGQITVTVTPADMRSDVLAYRVAIYAAFGDPADAGPRTEDVVAAISDELPAPWSDPVWAFGWNERLDLWMAEATITYPRALGD